MIKVSDSHGFWLNDNNQIKATELVAGESMINIKDGNGIKLVLVDIVEIIESDEFVYTFEVPGVHNYISDNIISHNTGTWNLVNAVPVSSQIGYRPEGSTDSTINVFISTSSTAASIRYSLQLTAASGYHRNTNSSGTGTNFYTTVSANYDNSTSNTAGYLSPMIIDGSIDVVVSDENTFVRIPRNSAGGGEIFRAKGGVSYFEKSANSDNPTTAIDTLGDIMPNWDSLYDIGSSAKRFANVWTDNLNGSLAEVLTAQIQNSGFTGIGTNVPNGSTQSDNYIKLHSGVIIQWGYSVNNSLVQFPTRFPTCFTAGAVASLKGGSGTRGYNHIHQANRDRMSFWIAIGH